MGAALLFLPGHAAASSAVFGLDLNTLGVGQSMGDLNATNVINLDGTSDNGAPVGGVLTSVRVKTSTAGAGGDGVIKVLTLVSHPDATTYNFLNDGPEIPVHVPSGTDVVTQVLTRRPLAAGQRLGWFINDPTYSINEAYPDGNHIGDCAYNTGGNHAVGATLTYTSYLCNNNLPLLSGTVESDADGDGYGDDTQDLCPTDASIHGPCPTTPATTTPPTGKKKCKKKKRQRGASVVVAKKKKCKKKRR